MQRPLPENTALTTDIHVLSSIRTRNPRKRAAAALERVATGIGLFNRKHSRRTEVQVSLQTLLNLTEVVFKRMVRLLCRRNPEGAR